MLLGDLLKRAELQLSLLTEDGHGLDRAVTGIVTTDLPDPGRYLSGGEVVLTGLVWHRGAQSSERFVAALASAGVTALGAGEAALGSVPDDLLAACVRHHVPLFKVPVEVSFNAIVEAAAPAMWSDRATGLSSALGRQRMMIAALATGAHLLDLLPRIAEQLGLQCWVWTATGSRLAATGPVPPEVSAAALTTFHSGVRLPAQVPLSKGEPPITVHRAGGTASRRIDAWCVASRGGAPDAAEELVSLVELERASTDERHRMERSLMADLLHAARHDGDPAILRAHMSSCGLAPEDPFAVIGAQLLARHPGTTASMPVALEMLDQLVRSGVDGQPGDRVCAAAEVDGCALSILPLHDGVAAGVSRIRDALKTLEPSLDGSRIAMGISSRASDAEGLRDAIRQAVNMLHLAASQQSPTALMANDQVASHTLLLAAVPAQTRQAFHDHLLGNLLAYDRDRQAELVPTLRAFLESSGSWKVCAQRLHVHVNTLRYRLRRIEQLTGRDLSRFDDWVDLYLAIRLDR